MKNVLLVFGGKSYEHDISVVTASQVYNKTRIQDVNLVPFYVSRENEYFLYEQKKFDLSDFSKKNFQARLKKFKRVSFVSGEDNVLFVKSAFGLKEYMRIDLAVFACHGGAGENGKLVSVLESVNISCSAGSFDALAVCMNKFLFKQTMKGLHVPVVSGFKISQNDFETNYKWCFKQSQKLGYPVIIKSNSGGSSIGLFIANSEKEFKEKIELAFEFDREVLVEKLLKNTKEFNIAVLGTSDDFEVSEIDEPVKHEEILSFTDKYLSGGKSGKGQGKLSGTKSGSMASQTRKFPADIDDCLRKKIRKYAASIFKNLNLSGVVRIDFLFVEELNKLYVCEVNAIPGSLSYYFFNKGGILMNEVTLKLIEAAEKNRKNMSLVNSNFCTEILS